MKSTILIIATVLLVIGTAVAVYFVIDASGLNKDLTAKNESLSDELANTEQELADSQDEAAALSDEIDTLTAKKSSLTTELEDTTDEKADLTSALSALQDDYDSLLEFSECTYEDYPELDMSYGTNSSISDILADWVEDAWEGVTGADWITLWEDDTDLSMHTIEFGTNAADYFLVFFDDSGFGTVQGVFYIWDQCWLDLTTF
jgi:predicted nuclease with TOPRIM domain